VLILEIVFTYLLAIVQSSCLFSEVEEVLSVFFLGCLFFGGRYFFGLLFKDFKSSEIDCSSMSSVVENPSLSKLSEKWDQFVLNGYHSCEKPVTEFQKEET